MNNIEANEANQPDLRIHLTLPQEAEGMAVGIFRENIEAEEKRARTRRNIDKQRLESAIGHIVKSILYYRARGYTGAIRYSRRNGFYNQFPYTAEFGTESLIAAIEGLSSAGLLEANLGYKNLQAGTGSQSTFRPTGDMNAYLAGMGLLETCPQIDLDKFPMVILKNERKEIIPFPEDTPVAVESANFLREWNSRLQDCTINYHEISPDIRYSPIVPSALCRIFNNSSWNQGGRLYGGWWQDASKIARRHIIIDNTPTVELDYSGFIVRAIYHQLGIDYQGDPYEIPLIYDLTKRNNANWETVRNGIKKMLAAKINSGPMNFPEKITGYNFPRGITRIDASKLIEEYHSDIARTFQKSVGLSLMNLESNITMRVLKHFLEKDLIVLPIHDSFIVAKLHETQLRQIMETEYRKEFNFKPIIK